jgi:stage III sporulation protein AF
VGVINVSQLIREWITNLVVISILGLAADLLLPNGSIKKYARFLIGIIVLVAMLKPIFQIFNQLSNLEKYTIKTSMAMDFASMNHQSKWLDNHQQQEIRDYFVESLKSHMEQQIRRFKGYEQVKVEVDISAIPQNDNRLPDIQKVYIEIGYQAGRVIEPVRIKVGGKDGDISQPDTKGNKDLAKDEQEIKGLLSSIYGISLDNIHIVFNPL